MSDVQWLTTQILNIIEHLEHIGGPLPTIKQPSRADHRAELRDVMQEVPMRSADELAQPLMRAVDQLALMGRLGRAIKRAALATEDDPADPDMAALPALWLATIERSTGLCVRHAESCAAAPDRERMGDAMRTLIELATRYRRHSNFDAVARWALIEED